MSVLSVPLVGDAAARLLAALADLAPKRRGAFSDLAADTSVVAVPTRHGQVRCTVYRPPGGSARGAPAYVNIHGGGFVIRYPEQDDACRRPERWR